MVEADMYTTPDRGQFSGEHVGPFYDRDSASMLTGLPVEQFGEKVAAGDILEVLTEGGKPLYPSFQFGSLEELLPGLATVTAILRPSSEDLWDVAIWLVTPTEQFDGRSAVETLKAGDIDHVVEVARGDALLRSI